MGGGAAGSDCLFPYFTRHEENYDTINIIISKLAYEIYLVLVESWQSERANN